MNYKDMPPEVRFIFMTMMQAAIKLKEMGENKEQFKMFASEIWESMEMNNIEDLKNVLRKVMLEDIQELKEKNGMDSRG